ncbi:hypothetical protein RJ640_017477 [Escallonia rubra]|uniref:Uncharacterized protein n=1 Tax=Escallonia rubra TaxID=112253 RepID=A0AA88RG18_9ASTE|nr:hypothetical protein RJ640_017477 [Escallonia rubra]
MAEAPEDKPNTSSTPSPSSHSSSSGGDYHIDVSKPLQEVTLWIDYVAQQAQLAQQTIEQTLESTVAVARSRLDRIVSTSSAHLSQTIDSLQDLKSEYSAYEGIAFGKLKEGIRIAASHPVITSGVVVGSGLLVLKRPRRFLYNNTLRIFLSEEALLSRADAKVKGLRQTIDVLKAESEKLEKAAVQAEEELKRGKTKLRQAGNQIQDVIRTAYKIERQADGLKDILKELPSRESSRFRSQVSNLASEAKRERNALSKEVTKISNYGISV